MNIAIVGTGYVGLVTGTTLAELGNTVYCVDIDETKVENMKKVEKREPQIFKVIKIEGKEGRS